jgi:hypothetical protein
VPAAAQHGDPDTREEINNELSDEDLAQLPRIGGH